MAGLSSNLLPQGHDSAVKAALTGLVHEILDHSSVCSSSVADIDPDDAVLIARKSLRDERQKNDQLRAELHAIHSSRGWMVAQLLSQLRHLAIPKNSYRSKIARSSLRLARRLGAGRFVGHLTSAWSKPQPSKTRRRTDPALRKKLNELAARCESGRPLFIFLPSIPWDMHLFQRPQHLARHLAQQGHVVVYDCSGMGPDADGLVEREPNLFLFKGDVEHLTALPDPILWAFAYNYSLRDRYPQTCRVVYDWIDDLTVFPYDQGMLERNHRRAIREATVVTSVARRLHDVALRSRPDAIYLPNAVEFDRFANPPAEQPNDPILKALIAEGKPIAGYYGALASWFDYTLLEEVAALKPDWNFLLIGPDYDGSIPDHPILRRSNIHWVGPKPYTELPAYLQAMACALIPFKINDITLATSPLKLYEYLAAGKPVITTSMPECMAYPEVHIASSPQAFCTALDAALIEAGDVEVRERNRLVGRLNSWAARVETIQNRLGALRQVQHLETTTNRGFFRALTEFFAQVSSGPCFRLWFEYALTSNDRGRKVAEELAKHTAIAGKQYLDVGCAYGGFLVAFAERGAEVQGVDCDPGLLALARKNLNEQGIDAPLSKVDAIGADFRDRFSGKLDIITCNDVIEHVDDPSALVTNLAEAVRPGGCLYLEIPNKDYPPYVLEDGHFRLFGITLLEHDEARAYYNALHPETAYSVGHYLRMEEYTALLDSAGFDVELLEPCLLNANLKTTLAAVEALKTEGGRRLQQVPEPFRTTVSDQLERYLTELEGQPRDRDDQQRAFKVRYAVSFWQILARKRQAAPERGQTVVGPH